MTKEEFELLPRDKRWSYSRISAFMGCPRKHYYSYIEEIRGKGNIYTQLGDFWHRLMEARNKGEDPEPILLEYEKASKAGAIDKPVDLMRFVYTEYCDTYPLDNVLYTEETLYEEWEDGDVASFKIDCIYEQDGLNILKDYKTTINKPKYSFTSTKYNQQLLLYKAVAEEAYGIVIHGIEIEEVRLCMLEEVPINKNGKPTADVRRLGLVKYETYFDLLSEMGIETMPEYANALTELSKRGHPLFTRYTVDISDTRVVDENLTDMYESYKLAKTGCKARKRSVLCDYCDLSRLCEADYSYLDDEGREIIIEDILKKS